VSQKLKKLFFIIAVSALSLALFAQGISHKSFFGNKEVPVKGFIGSDFLYSDRFVGLNGFDQNILLKNSQVDSNQDILKQILNKTRRYCEKVKKVALFYVCKENIKSKINYYKRGTKLTRNQYGEISEFYEATSLKLKRTKEITFKYDYQLIKKEGKIEEKRVLLEKNRKKKHKENAELEIKYQGKYMFYGPVGFLSRYWQNYFYYEIVGQELLDGKTAIVVKTSPKPSNKENRNYAKIWIDEKDFSILQIEWEPESIISSEEKKPKSKKGDLKKKIIWIVTYGVEKNGIRFPSRQLIQEFLLDYKGDKKILEEYSFIYNDYEFFTVEVEIKH